MSELLDVKICDRHHPPNINLIMTSCQNSPVCGIMIAPYGKWSKFERHNGRYPLQDSPYVSSILVSASLDQPLGHRSPSPRPMLRAPLDELHERHAPRRFDRSLTRAVLSS